MAGIGDKTDRQAHIEGRNLVEGMDPVGRALTGQKRSRVAV
jgi:hypothetical protein